MATVTTILDRLHEINASLSYGGSASRYYPQNADSAKLPLVVPTFRAVQATTLNGNVWQIQRTFELIIFCENAMAGLPSKSAQQAAETTIETLEDAYIARPRLKYSGTDLDGVMRVTVGQDSGLEVGADGLFQVRLPLSITYVKTIQLQ